MMHPAFVYTDVDQGLDLIEIVDPGRVVGATNSWRPGRPLEHGTERTSFTAMIERVRGIVDKAAKLIDSKG